jgi:hypothetical protein
MGASFPIVAQAVPDLFLGLLVVGDGKRFELVEPDFLGSVSFDESEGRRWRVLSVAERTGDPLTKRKKSYAKPPRVVAEVLTLIPSARACG